MNISYFEWFDDERNPHDFIDESFRGNFWGLGWVGWDFIVEAPDETYVKTRQITPGAARAIKASEKVINNVDYTIQTVAHTHTEKRP